MTEALEIWGGLECTVNRVNDRFSDQCERTGHWARGDDLARIGALGISKLRYPVLWESVCPDNINDFCWSRVDQRLSEIRGLGIEPIAGLIHHGSGPRYTSLLDPGFAEKLGFYAACVAERFPWLQYYTPVNEPLTTARFSCLYGHWYPHTKDGNTFLRALVNETKATIFAMEAIRRVNPSAQLIQTEEMSQVLTTPPLRYQGEYENHRRFLSIDLLCGRIKRGHPFYRALAAAVGEPELNWIRDNACLPDVLGVNHYLLSTRFLDHRLNLYPPEYHGGNGKDAYADVGAVDTGQAIPPLPADIFREIWRRYRLPMAITEVHCGGAREAQMRWLKEIWSAARELRDDQIDIRALTVWSLFGNYDWISLCTRCEQHYEAGVFDVRARAPRRTALANMVQDLCAGRVPRHPALERPGYWREPLRVLFAPSELTKRKPPITKLPSHRRPVLITGANGTLGRAFAKVCERRGVDYVVRSHAEMDIATKASVARELDDLNPWAVINTAGYVHVDQAETDHSRCRRDNLEGPKNIAELCAAKDLAFLTFSSDLVFDGRTQEPYRESDLVSPINFYGRSKAASERVVLAIHPKALVVRTSAFFGPWDQHNFVRQTLSTLNSNQPLFAAEDIIISPTYVPDLVWACLDLLMDGETGILHLANKGAISWAEWARWVAENFGADTRQIIGCSSDEMPYKARRPRYSALQSERVDIMPPFEHALGRFLAEAR